MPIKIQHIVHALKAGTQVGKIARELARQSVDQYALQKLTGPGSGIAEGSCWAALAVRPSPSTGFGAGRAVNTANPYPGSGPSETARPLLPYAVVFGQSQLAAIARKVRVPGMPGTGFSTHAEKNALIIAGGNGVLPYTLSTPENPKEAVMFCELACCPGCNRWLQGESDVGIANPFQRDIDGDMTLNILYRFPFTEAGKEEWEEWHARSRNALQRDIDKWADMDLPDE